MNELRQNPYHPLEINTQDEKPPRTFGHYVGAMFFLLVGGPTFLLGLFLTLGTFAMSSFWREPEDPPFWRTVFADASLLFIGAGWLSAAIAFWLAKHRLGLLIACVMFAMFVIRNVLFG